MTKQFRVGLLGDYCLYEEKHVEEAGTSQKPICKGKTPDELKAVAKKILPATEFSLAESAIDRFIRNNHQ